MDYLGLKVLIVGGISFGLMVLLASCGVDDGVAYSEATCSVLKEDNKILIRCPDGSVIDATPMPGKDGLDGTGCEVEEFDDGYLVTCEDTEVFIPNGTSLDEDDDEDSKEPTDDNDDEEEPIDDNDDEEEEPTDDEDSHDGQSHDDGKSHDKKHKKKHDDDSSSDD